MTIYRTFSTLQLAFHGLGQIGYLIIMGISVFFYHDNPILSIILIIISLFFFLISGSDELILTNDYLKFTNNRILKLSRRSVSICVDKIVKFEVVGSFSSGDELYDLDTGAKKGTNTVLIYCSDGSMVKFETSIYLSKLKAISIKLRGVQKHA